MTPLKTVIRWPRLPMVRILQVAAYELRDRNASPEGKPASITYSTVTRETPNGEAVA